jgi:hypothetical protein
MTNVSMNVYDFKNVIELTDKDLTQVNGAGVAGFGLGSLALAPFVAAFNNAIGTDVAFNLNFAARPFVSSNFLTAIF